MPLPTRHDLATRHLANTLLDQGWFSIPLLLVLLPGCGANEQPPQGFELNTGGASTSDGVSGSGGVSTGGAVAATGGLATGGASGAGGTTGGNDQATGGAGAAGGTAAGGDSTGGRSLTGGRGPTGGHGPLGGGGAAGSDAFQGGTAGSDAFQGGTAGSDAFQGGTAGGSAFQGGTAPAVRFVGNITTGWNGALDTNGLTYSDHWNQVSPENAGKWGAVQGSPTSGFNWNTLDAIHDYTTQKGILFKEHCFLWGSQQPEPQSSITETHVKNWMQQFCDRYPDAVVIDVVNEPPPHTNPQYANAIGGGTNGNWAWIANAFKWADAACPNAILVLNDYNTIEWPNDNQRFIDIVKAIQAAGAPIDAVGAQAHDLDHGSVTFATVERLLTKLHDDTGLPVYITEMDLSYTDDAAQLSAYQRFFPLFWEAPYVQGITIWGWIYGQTWSMAPNSGLVRDGRSRSAMTWLMDQLDRPAP